MKTRVQLVSVALLGLAACGETAADPAATAEPEAARIDVRVAGIDEIEAEIRASRGKGLLINHWATW